MRKNLAMSVLLFAGFVMCLDLQAERSSDASLAKILASVAKAKHPRLLFSDIKKTRGWKNRESDPWMTFFSNVQKATDQKKSIAEVYSGPASGAIAHAGGRAHEGELIYDPSFDGFMFIATGNPKYLDSGLDLLKNLAPKEGLDTETGEDEVLSRFLIRYCLLYDFLFPSLTKSDKKLVTLKLAEYANLVYAEYALSRNPHRRIVLASALGVAALALAGEDISTKSVQLDWLRTATYGMAVSDSYKWHPALVKDGPIGVLEGVCNKGGYCRLGGYRSYWVGIFAKWLVIYNAATGQNPLDDYPYFRKVIVEPLISAMPNRMDRSQGTRSGSYWQYLYVLSDMLSKGERDALKWYSQPDNDRYPLRDRFTTGDVWNDIYWFLFYPEMDKKPQNPPWRSGYIQGSEVFTFRSSWSDNPLWFSFNAINLPIGSHRDMGHNDNMSFELFACDDYLLCDPSEVKHRMRGYGPTSAFCHNSILIDGLGMVKENVEKEYFTFVDPASFTMTTISNDFTAFKAEVEITEVEADPNHALMTIDRKDINAKPLDGKCTWTRTVFFPFGEYVVILDKIKQDKPREVSYQFHLSSLGVVPSTDKTIGHVIGELSTGGKTIDWLAGDTITDGNRRTKVLDEGNYSNSTFWRTTNMSGTPISLIFHSAPKADKMEVWRTWGTIPRVKDDRNPSWEVDHPCISLTNKSDEFFRLTVLYPSDTKAQMPQIESITNCDCVTIMVHKGTITDVISAGNRRIKNANFESNAELAFISMKNGEINVAGLFEGSYIKTEKEEVLRASSSVSALMLLKRGLKRTVDYTNAEKFSLQLPFQHKGAALSELPEDTFSILTGQWKPELSRQNGPSDRLSCPAGAYEIELD